MRCHLIFAIAVVLLVVSGCIREDVNSLNENNLPSSRQDAKSQAIAQGANEGAVLSYLFNYSKMKSYAYMQTTRSASGELFTIFHHKVSDESVNGIPSWKIEIEGKMDNQQVDPNIRGYSEFWFAKQNDSCLKSHNVLENYGNKTFTENICGAAVTWGNNPHVMYPFLGNETITTRMGTYETMKYGLAGVTYYMAKDMPAPVKMIWGKEEGQVGSITLELIYFT